MIDTCNGDLSACPFANTDESDMVQNYGCLPMPFEIITMRVKYEKTWACHDNHTTPCIGAINTLKSKKLPYGVIDTKLVTEHDDWSIYCE